uniref:EF-hand domain-containing protein n=1 Tax=Trypanosoma congolense (strain IL3000) TaxID=1068625 RepID=G0UVZ4_TRYCI|nr:conserved hypothetical protein [Trypanosoma congolense IL3000]
MINESDVYSEKSTVVCGQRNVLGPFYILNEEDNVISAYVRLLEREKKRNELPMDSIDRKSDSYLDTVTSGTREDVLSTSFQRGDPAVPLSVLAQMRLAFDLYEWRDQMKQNPVLALSTTSTYERNSKEEVAAMLRYKKQCLELQRNINEQRGTGHYRGDAGKTYTSDTLLGSLAPGMPFADFERDIVKPFFYAIFPVGDARHRSQSYDVTDSKGRRVLQSNRPLRRSGVHHAVRPAYDRRCQSHVEAAEHLFRTMDTDADGLVTWDELSSYIIESGQRQLVKGNNAASPTMTTYDDTLDYPFKAAVGGSPHFALNLTDVPGNITLWQKRYPLVRLLYHRSPITHMVFVDQGKRLVTAAWDGLVKLWRTDPRLAGVQGKPAIVHERNLLAIGAPILDMALSSKTLGDVEVLAVLAIDCTITLVRPGTGEVLKTFLGRFSVDSVPQGFKGSPSLRSTPSVVSRRKPSVNTDTGGNSNDGGGGSETATVMRPQYKIRAYRSETRELLFTDVSRYFTGLGVVAPTFEHLERPYGVKTDVFLSFGVCIRHESPRGTPSKMRGLQPRRGTQDGMEMAKNQLATNSSFGTGNMGDEQLTEEAGKTTNLDRVISPSSPKMRIHAGYRAEDVFWFGRCLTMAFRERVSSNHPLLTGPLMIIGFCTGVVQFYLMQRHWFDMYGLTKTRLESAVSHEPILSVQLHRMAITKIVLSEAHDLIITVSEDCTVGVRHMSRIEVPYLTLGGHDDIPASIKPSLNESTCDRRLHKITHGKRITCACWHPQRTLIVTGSYDRTILYWVPFSSRPLHCTELSLYVKSALMAGYPVDLSFAQMPRHGQVLIVVDSKRTLYFFDVDVYQCLTVLQDDGLGSMRSGEMFCVRYDAVDDRLILGGYYPRVWDTKHKDEYPTGYCGHRKPVVGFVHHKKSNLWFSADDSFVIVWRHVIEAVVEGRKKSFSFPTLSEISLKSIEKMGTVVATDAIVDYKLMTMIERTWTVEGGICCVAVEQSESAHVFLALEHGQRILEYNGLNGSLMRTLIFPSNVSEPTSLACGFMMCKDTLRNPMFLICGTFETGSPDGTTALYALQCSRNGTLPALGENNIAPHRHIVTARVGVSFAIIYEALGIVVIGHRGGISTTPVNEVTKCPIPCTCLTERLLRKSLVQKYGDLSLCGLSRQSLPTYFTSAPMHPHRGSHEFTAPEQVVSFSGKHSAGREWRSQALRGKRNSQSTSIMLDHYGVHSPLDLVALLPGPLIPDPIEYTREYMLQRERYLTSGNDNQSSNNAVTFSGGKASFNKAPSESTQLTGITGEELPPLLLFSDGPDGLLPKTQRDGGFFLREEFTAIGFVGHIIPIDATGYLVTGSDDGLIQIWNCRSRLEVMRFRVTFDLDPITAMEVSQNGFHIAVADSRGHLVLLDVSGIDWVSETPLEKVPSLHECISMRYRWSAHRNNVTAVRFAEGVSREVFQTTGIRGPLDSCGSLTKVQNEEALINESGVLVGGMPYGGIQSTVFICTSGDDGFVHVWRLLLHPDLLIRGRDSDVTCIGYFGNNDNMPTKPFRDRLNSSAIAVLDVVREIYLSRRVLPMLADLVEGNHLERMVEKAMEVISDDMHKQRVHNTLRNVRRGSVLSESKAFDTHTAKKRCGTSLQGSFYRDRTNSAISLKNANVCLLSYALAFEKECFTEPTLQECLMRLFSKLNKKGSRAVAPPTTSRGTSRRKTVVTRNPQEDQFNPGACALSPDFHESTLSPGKAVTSGVEEKPTEGSPLVMETQTTSNAIQRSNDVDESSENAPRVHLATSSSSLTHGGVFSPNTNSDSRARQGSVFASVSHFTKPTSATCVEAQLPFDKERTTEGPFASCSSSHSSGMGESVSSMEGPRIPQPRIIVRSRRTFTILSRRHSKAKKGGQGHAQSRKLPGNSSCLLDGRPRNVSNTADVIGTMVGVEHRRGVKTLLEDEEYTDHSKKSVISATPSKASQLGNSSNTSLSGRACRSTSVAERVMMGERRLAQKLLRTKRVRVVNTLMKWKVGKKTAQPNRKWINRVYHSPDMLPAREASLSSHSDAPPAPFVLPMLIPAVMNNTKGVSITINEESNEIKTLMSVLKEENDLMKTILAGALQEKEQLLARDKSAVLRLPNIKTSLSGN